MSELLKADMERLKGKQEGSSLGVRSEGASSSQVSLWGSHGFLDFKIKVMLGFSAKCTLFSAPSIISAQWCSHLFFHTGNLVLDFLAMTKLIRLEYWSMC